MVEIDNVTGVIREILWDLLQKRKEKRRKSGQGEENHNLQENIRAEGWKMEVNRK